MKNYTLTITLALLALRGAAQINAYASVTSISGKTLSLTSVNQTYHTFNTGDQIIIMQMQDDVIGSNTSNTTSFGNISTIASAGKYEVATIASVTGLPGSLKVATALTNTYNTGAGKSVQIISFRKYGSPDYTTTAAITALPWNGQIGGVVAMQVPGTLTLAYSVSADAAGFRGGDVSSNYENTCQPAVYASNSSNYAARAEGIQANNTGFLYGRNALANGGGGGSDDNAGGGGGSNFSAGGVGGHGWTCAASPAGGFGGNSLAGFITVNRIFMGGGGGGGQQNNSVGTVGGRGGGIVMIKANVLKTSCSGTVTISANGAASVNSGNDGAGGGGAGGTVVMSISSFSVPSGCPLKVQGNGGGGGSVGDAGAHGGGGGGGQGAILYPAAVPSTNITSTTATGAGGANNNSGGSYAGTGGGSPNSGVLPNNGYILLPVKITDFTASLSGSSVKLRWQTSLEVNNDHFEIQRSAGNADFKTIGMVRGAGNSTLLQNYSFTDGTPGNGTNYYRLKQVDIDNRESYSVVLPVKMQTSETAFAVYPNPINDAFTIRIQAEQNTPVSVTMTDLSGKLLFKTAGYANGGLMKVVLTQKPASGFYMLTATTLQNQFTAKVLVQ